MSLSELLVALLAAAAVVEPGPPPATVGEYLESNGLKPLIRKRRTAEADLAIQTAAKATTFARGSALSPPHATLNRSVSLMSPSRVKPRVTHSHSQRPASPDTW
jgi:hypothetical protein